MTVGSGRPLPSQRLFAHRYYLTTSIIIIIMMSMIAARLIRTLLSADSREFLLIVFEELALLRDWVQARSPMRIEVDKVRDLSVD